MAFVQDPLNPQNQPGQAGQPAPQTAGGAGANTASGGPQGVSAMPGSTKAPPVQDLKAYLEANQPQAVQMGQNIAGNLNQAYQGAVGGVNAAQSSVDKTIQGQTVTPNQALIDRAAANPTQFVQDPNNVTAFQQQRDATYAGPASFEGTDQYGQAAQSIANAQQKAPDINQTEGIVQLARGQEKNPTAGMSNLDALLLQGTPDSINPVKSAVGQFANLPGQLSGAATKENAAIQQAMANATQASGAVKSTFAPVVSNWEQALSAELPQAQQGYDAYNLAVQNIINQQNGGLNSLVNSEQSSLSALNNILGPQFGYSQNFSPLSVVPSAATVAPTQANVATSQDYAMEAALQQLLGGGFGAAPLDQANAAQAGTWQSPGAPPTLPISQAKQDAQAILDRLNYNPLGVTAPRIPQAQAVYNNSQALLNYLNGLS